MAAAQRPAARAAHAARQGSGGRIPLTVAGDRNTAMRRASRCGRRRAATCAVRWLSEAPATSGAAHVRYDPSPTSAS